MNNFTEDSSTVRRHIASSTKIRNAALKRLRSMVTWRVTVASGMVALVVAGVVFFFR